MIKRKKILYYCSWGGFGHIARAYSVLKYLNDCEILVCSPQDWIFPKIANIKYVKLHEPLSIQVFKNSSIERKDYTSKDDTLGYRKFLNEYLEVLKNFNPDVVVVDITAEIAVTTKLLGYKTIIVYETLQTDELRWTLSWGASDGILVPYPKVFASAINFKFADKSFFAGGYSRFEGEENITRIESRRMLGIEKDQQVFLITMGKARMGGDLIKQLITMLNRRPNSKIFLLYFKHDEFSQALQNEFTSLEVISGETNTQKYFSAADLILSGAGYNSMMEIFEFRVPAIFFPLERINGEQYNKARVAKLIKASEYIDLTKKNWQNNFTKILDKILSSKRWHELSRNQVKIVSGDGAKKAAEYIINF